MIRVRVLACSVAVIAAGVTLFSVVGPAPEMIRVLASSRLVIPRTISLLETSTDANGVSVKARHTKCVRADGSQVTIDQELNSSDEEVINENREIIFADRLIVRLNPKVKAKSSRRTTAARFTYGFLGMQRDPSGDCIRNYAGEDLRVNASEEISGHEQIAGYPAVRIVTRGTPEITSWYAPGLACELVRQVVRYRVRDSASGQWGTGESTKSVESILVGPPKDEFFDVPSAYEEVKPSELNARIVERLTGERKSCNRSSDERLDRLYSEQRP